MVFPHPAKQLKQRKAPEHRDTSSSGKRGKRRGRRRKRRRRKLWARTEKKHTFPRARE